MCWESATGLEPGKGKHASGIQILFCDDLLVFLEGLSEKGGGKGSSTLVMTHAQRKMSSWALEITAQYFSWCVGRLVCFQPLKILREHQHQTTCAQGVWQGSFCAAHRTRVLGVESSLYLLGFTWIVVMSWVLDRPFMSFRCQQLWHETCLSLPYFIVHAS